MVCCRMLKSLALVLSIIGLTFVVTVKCKKGMFNSDHIFLYNLCMYRVSQKKVPRLCRCCGRAVALEGIDIAIFCSH